MRTRLAAALLVLSCSGVAAQQPTTQPAPVETGWEWFGLPTVNFNSDEGFGYGALLELYNYGNGVKPYRFMIRPLVLFTTKGRRDVALVFDAPRLLPTGWRLDAFLGREQQLATPYYGVGNATVNDTTLSDPPDDYFYRYGKTQFRAAVNVQRNIQRSARLVGGVGFLNVTTDKTPFDSGTTLVQAQQTAASSDGDKQVYVRGGVVLYTRDREIGPTKGYWIDLLGQRAFTEQTFGFSRVTFSARGYAPLTSRLVFAQRAVVQQVSSDVPFFELATLQSMQPGSSLPEGLGGSGSVRGLSKNRYIGKGIAFSNSELRWRATDFKLRGKTAYLVASAFFDAGRVWDGNIDAGEMFSDLHAGYGGGLRLGLGPSFLIAFDLGKSSESTQIYIGLGYPF